MSWTGSPGKSTKSPSFAEQVCVCFEVFSGEHRQTDWVYTALMGTPLDPLVSEFATAEEAEAYDRWFRARVARSLADPRPSIPHDEAMASIRAQLDAKIRDKTRAD